MPPKRTRRRVRKKPENNESLQNPSHSKTLKLVGPDGNVSRIQLSESLEENIDQNPSEAFAPSETNEEVPKSSNESETLEPSHSEPPPVGVGGNDQDQSSSARSSNESENLEPSSEPPPSVEEVSSFTGADSAGGVDQDQSSPARSLRHFTIETKLKVVGQAKTSSNREAAR